MLKTKLPEAITTVEEAQSFLTELHNNHESFHPEDDATTINWHLLPTEDKPTKQECIQLNKLMEDIWELRDQFDACGFLLDLMRPFLQTLNQ